MALSPVRAVAYADPKSDGVQVHYTGKLTDGTVFDSGNISFKLGAGQVAYPSPRTIWNRPCATPPPKGIGTLAYRNDNLADQT